MNLNLNILKKHIRITIKRQHLNRWKRKANVLVRLIPFKNLSKQVFLYPIVFANQFDIQKEKKTKHQLGTN